MTERAPHVQNQHIVGVKPGCASAKENGIQRGMSEARTLK